MPMTTKEEVAALVKEQVDKLMLLFELDLPLSHIEYVYKYKDEVSSTYFSSPDCDSYHYREELFLVFVSSLFPFPTCRYVHDRRII